MSDLPYYSVSFTDETVACSDLTRQRALSDLFRLIQKYDIRTDRPLDQADLVRSDGETILKARFMPTDAIEAREAGFCVSLIENNPAP